jgi:hypothetical protein
MLSSNVIDEAAYPDLRDLIVNRSASKSQYNGGERSILEEFVEPDFR